MRKLVSAIVMLLAFLNVPAQDRQNEASIDSMIAIYNSQRGTALPIFNGRQFIGYSHLIQGFPYFLSSEWQPGSAMYEGTWFHNLSLMYDAYQDQVIVRSPNGFPYILISERLQEFKLGKEHFIRIDEESAARVKPAFYHRLTDGKVMVLGKRIKKMEERIDGSEVDRKFFSADKFFIFKDEKLEPILKQRDLLESLKDKRQEVQSLIKKEDLRFKSNPELTIIKAVEFYNQSTK